MRVAMIGSGYVGLVSGVCFADIEYEVMSNAQHRALDFGRLKSVMAKPVLVDLRNIYRPDELTRHGFAYEGVGRRSSRNSLH